MCIYVWTTFETYLQESASYNRHAIPRFYVDYPRNPEREEIDSQIPDYLFDSPYNLQKTYYRYGSSNNELYGYSPDYSNAYFQDMIINFIHEFADKYVSVKIYLFFFFVIDMFLCRMVTKESM